MTALVAPAAVAAPATTGPKPARAEQKVHVVKQGESLSSIARAERVSSWKRLFDANLGVKHPDLIYPGQKLVIPDEKAKLKSRPIPSNGQPLRGPIVRASASSGAKRAAPAARPVSTRARRSGGSSVGGGVWDKLAACESGGNWSINTGNGYSGGLQFSPSTWRAHGGKGSPHNASKAEQIRVAKRVQQSQGWGAWPACSRKLGLR